MEPDRSAEQARALTRIVLRPIGSPLPLGFFAFCFGTVLLSALELGWLPQSEGRVLALIMLAFVAPLELLPSLLAYFARDTVGATVMGLFAENWVVTALFFLTAPGAASSPTLALFFCLNAAALLGLAIIAIPSKPFFAVLLLAATARMVLSAMRQFGMGEGIQHAGGIVGLCLAAIALYGAFALLIEDTHQETVLPLFRRGAARAAIEGGLHEQIDRLKGEAGVRQQL